MHAETPSRWAGTWLDVAAFVIGLGLAWWFDWTTTDLVWSLWLSSFAVGYALILGIQAASLRGAIRATSRRSNLPDAESKFLALAFTGLCAVFSLCFFTVHFGGFHLGHSLVLHSFFPVLPEGSSGLAGWDVYSEVIRRYWWFLPAALIAEREGFFRLKRIAIKRASDDNVAAHNAEGAAMLAPYLNVIRMHVLIFFFAAAHFARWNSFVVYAVVYAVYFFPWRVLRRRKQPALA